MFSVHDEINRLEPLTLAPEVSSDSPEPPGELEVWEELTRLLTRLAKEQFRATQNSEFLAETNRKSLDEILEFSGALKERSEEYRRDSIRAREELQASALKLLTIIDTLDDLGLLARQAGEGKWLAHVERLAKKVIDVYATIGLAEIPALDRLFDPEEHEPIGSVDREDGQEPHQVITVVQRGFRFNGAILRRAQVITTRP